MSRSSKVPRAYKPFTYVIGWPEHEVFYYGVRYARNTDPSDLWTRYFTSSKTVKLCRELWGEPTFMQVRKVFETAAEACAWEQRVLVRLGVRQKSDKSNKFLNQNTGRAPYHTIRRPQSPEERAKRSATMTGVKHTAERKAANSAAQRAVYEARRAMGLPKKIIDPLIEAERRKKISEGNKGKVRTEEMRARAAQAQIGKKQSPEQIAKRVAASKITKAKNRENRLPTVKHLKRKNREQRNREIRENAAALSSIALRDYNDPVQQQRGRLARKQSSLREAEKGWSIPGHTTSTSQVLH